MKEVRFILSFIFVIFTLNIIATPSIEVGASDKEFVSEYETWNFKGSDEELIKYYMKNNIRPANAQSGTGNKIEETGIPSFLSGRFPEYTSWMKSNDARDVSYTYGSNPIEISEYDAYIQKAKTNAGISYNSIGCGSISMLSQFDYLARNAGYSSIATNLESPIVTINAPNKTKLATEMFRNTDTVPADSFLGQLFGVDPDAGTFTFPVK